MLQRNSKLMTKKMIQYLIPSILMIFAMQFGSLLDGIFVGNLIGNDALTATSLVLPILFVVQLPGFALGTGGSIVVANLLGKREVSKAKTTFSLCMILAVGISLVFAILSFFVSEPLAALYCPAEFKELGRQYIFIYMVTDPVIGFALALACFVGVDNNPRLAAGMYIVANAVKVLTEFIFIKYLSMGVYGAALSTVVGYAFGSLLIILYIFSKRRLLSFTLHFEASKEVMGSSLKASSSTAFNLALTAIQMSVCNIFISRLIDPSSADILIFGVMANMMFVFDLLLGGVIQVIPNICGVLYGEKDYYGLRKIVKQLYFINIIVTVIVALILFLFPAFYCRIFGFDASVAPQQINLYVRIFVFAFIPYEISKFNQMYYPTIEKNMPAYITVFCRGAILMIPLSLILLSSFGLTGYYIGQLAAELGTVLLTYLFIFIYSKKKGLKNQGLFMIPSYKSIDKYDVTVNNDPKNASILSEEVESYALKHNVDARDAAMIALGAEEMASNIISYGYKMKHHHYYIDVTLKIVDNKLILTLKDDGIVFDPTQYKEEEAEFSTSGILLVKNIVDKISYTRVLNTNNTSIEIYLKGAK